MAEYADPSFSPDIEDTDEVVTHMQIALSAEQFARAMLICQKRNCSLETVVEDLIERFLPSPQPFDKNFSSSKPAINRTEAERTKNAQYRWIRVRRLKT